MKPSLGCSLQKVINKLVIALSPLKIKLYIDETIISLQLTKSNKS